MFIAHNSIQASTLRRVALYGIGAALVVLPLSGQAREQSRGTGRAEATMSVSLTVLDPEQAARFEGERFVTGTGASPACQSAKTCDYPPLPTIVAGRADGAKARTKARSVAPR